MESDDEDTMAEVVVLDVDGGPRRMVNGDFPLLLLPQLLQRQQQQQTALSCDALFLLQGAVGWGSLAVS